jgi:hypothetical protein
MNRTRFVPFLLLAMLPGAVVFGDPSDVRASGDVWASGEVQPPSAAAVMIRLYNLADTPEAEIARATSEASGIYERIGVQLVWFDCSATAPKKHCIDVSGPSVLNLRLMPSNMQPPGGLPKAIFGFALMSADGGFATTANVYVDRVSEIADGRKLRRSVVLGAMMAHELGHLLLGVKSHSKPGLMTLPWGPKALLAADRGMLGFSDREAKRIRQAVQARAGETEPSARAGHDRAAGVSRRVEAPRQAQ